MDNRNIDVVKAKLEALETELCTQIVFDVLHMKWERFNNLNYGEHEEYKEIVAELKDRYRNIINKPRQ